MKGKPKKEPVWGKGHAIKMPISSGNVKQTTELSHLESGKNVLNTLIWKLLVFGIYPPGLEIIDILNPGCTLVCPVTKNEQKNQFKPNQNKN